MPLKLLAMNCKNCGATLSFAQTTTILSCEKCGSQFVVNEPSPTSIKPQSRTPRRFSLSIDEVVLQRDKLLREIAFLEAQFVETGHPSIPKKIENARNKLKKLGS